MTMFTLCVKPYLFSLGVRSSVWVRCIQHGAKTNSETIMNVFDRKAKRQQRNRTAFHPDFKVYEYLKEEIGWRVADRISDVKRKFGVCADIGCGRGYVSRHVYSDMVGTMYQMDMAEHLLAQAEKSTEVPTYNIIGDEEYFPFKSGSLDLVTSSLSLHWVNDLPGTLRQIQNGLKNDGCFLGSMFGGDTLYELRSSLQLAETEREGGIAPHISPFTSVQDLGNLLNRAGFVLLTIDVDEMVIHYPSMFELMWDLKGMGESNCVWSRRLHLPRDTQMAAAAIYKELYSKPEQEGVPATFQILNFIGWKPDPSQRGPAKRGSANVSLKDLDKVNQITKDLERAKKETETSETDLSKLAEELEKVRTSITSTDSDNSNGKGKS